jgi:hypothetical protein
VKRRCCLLAALGLASAVCAALSAAQTPVPPSPAQTPAPPIGAMKPLGNDRFEIGYIVVDKRAGKFTVPGRVLNVGKPLEYFATTPKGFKAYESLLEVDATGSEFNLACILLGLERAADAPQFQRYSRDSLPGPRLALYVAWLQNGKRHTLSGAEALLDPEGGVKPASVEWVYIGSSLREGRFGADVTGILIGVVHDPVSVIESVEGVGIGAYGSVKGNPALPPVGSKIELIVEVPHPKK